MLSPLKRPMTFRWLAIGALATLAAAPALATTTIYTTQASFLAAVKPGSYTETFEGDPDVALSYSYSGSGYGYTVTAAPLQGLDDDVYLSGTFIGNTFSDASLTFTFSGTRPTAIGGNFYITNSADAFVPSAPVTLTLSDGTVTTFTPGSPSTYRGFTSTATIASLTLSAPGGGRFNTVDNLTVGTAVTGTVPMVPEPTTYALMAAGIAAMMFMARRSRQA